MSFGWWVLLAVPVLAGLLWGFGMDHSKPRCFSDLSVRLLLEGVALGLVLDVFLIGLASILGWCLNHHSTFGATIFGVFVALLIVAPKSIWHRIRQH